MKKFYLTTPIYYVNDKPHIGHAYTTLAADVLARFYREKGDEVFFLTGTDEHGQKVLEKAIEAGLKPKEFVDKNAKAFKDTYDSLGVSYDHFIRTTDVSHKEGVYEFFKSIERFIYKDKYEGLYCTGCEKFITEKELVLGKCPDHKKEPEKIKEENYFFKLKEFLPKVKELIESDEIEVRPLERKNEALKMCEDLKDFSISREKVSWGIPYPGDESQTIYVWVEALLNYWTAVRGKGLWPADLHIIGKDILKFHAIYWPALLLAAGEELPKKIFVHGFFTVDGEKMSKTVGNVIDPNELVKEFGVEATRYLLLSQFSFGRDGDISIEKLKKDYNSDLANGLGNLVNRLKKVEVKSFKEVEPDLENLDFYGVLEEVKSGIRKVDRFLDKEEPWKKNDDSIWAKAWEDLFRVAVLLKPFMPETAEKILKQEKVFFEKK